MRTLVFYAKQLNFVTSFIEMQKPSESSRQSDTNKKLWVAAAESLLLKNTPNKLQKTINELYVHYNV